MKDNSTEFVRIRYYSACLGNTTTETARCDKLKIGQQVNFTAKVEVSEQANSSGRVERGGVRREEGVAG